MLRISCAAAIFDEHRRVLMTKRRDDGQWCFPGGGMDPGETVA
jgi:8-oxo-dGTP pyrophosphatase MutT (NUDIX family)